MNIYCGNLPYGLTEAELRELFEQYGEVQSASIIMDRYTGQSKGFGFVEMSDDTAGEEAIAAINGSSVKGRSVKINQARPRTERRPRY